jgi:type IV pilus assembly protein PilA
VSPFGFTLIELLLVIGILAILAAIVLVAVDPAKRFSQARDARRWSEVNSLLNAILNYTTDNVGTHPAGIDGDTADSQQLGTAGSGCDVACNVTTKTSCLDLSTPLVTEYIAEIPVDPRGTDGTYIYDSTRTGYYVNRLGDGRILVGSCNPELVSEISVQR